MIRDFEAVAKVRYYVTTWDSDKQLFTPQAGVRTGPYSLFGLRRALRKLRAMGYDTKRSNAHSIMVDKTADYGGSK